MTIQADEFNILSEGHTYDTLGGRISKAREQAGLTLKTAAELAGVRRATLKSWETDASEPRINKLNTLAGIFGVSVTYFMAGEGHKGEMPTASYSKEELLASVHAQLADLQASQNQIAEMIDRVNHLLSKID